MLEHEDVHRAYGGIALPNPASIALHKRFGFSLIGCFTQPGRKFGLLGRRLVRTTGWKELLRAQRDHARELFTERVPAPP